MKYDKMVAVNKAESEKKIELAIQAIDDMSSKIGYISVTELVKQTGLSRGFFYKNKIVRERLDQVSENVDILVKGIYLREGDDIQGLRKKLKQLDGENNKLKICSDKMKNFKGRWKSIINGQIKKKWIY